MKQVLLIQGGGQGTHEEWDNNILDSLERELGPDYAIRYPRMPMRPSRSMRPGRRRSSGNSLGSTTAPSSLATRSVERSDPNLGRRSAHVDLGGIFLIAAPFVGAADGTARIWNRSSIWVPNCLNRRRSISITEARTKQPRSSMFTSTRRPFRGCRAPTLRSRPSAQ